MLGRKFKADIHDGWCVKIRSPLKTHRWEAGQKKGLEIKLKVTREAIYFGGQESTFLNKAGTVCWGQFRDEKQARAFFPACTNTRV